MFNTESTAGSLTQRNARGFGLIIHDTILSITNTTKSTESIINYMNIYRSLIYISKALSDIRAKHKSSSKKSRSGSQFQDSRAKRKHNQVSTVNEKHASTSTVSCSGADRKMFHLGIEIRLMKLNNCLCGDCNASEELRINTDIRLEKMVHENT